MIEILERSDEILERSDDEAVKLTAAELGSLKPGDLLTTTAGRQLSFAWWRWSDYDGSPWVWGDSRGRRLAFPVDGVEPAIYGHGELVDVAD